MAKGSCQVPEQETETNSPLALSPYLNKQAAV